MISLEEAALVLREIVFVCRATKFTQSKLSVQIMTTLVSGLHVRCSSARLTSFALSVCLCLSISIRELTHLDHPNIVKYIGSYHDRSNLYIITEKCTGGEVFDRLLKVKRFSEQEVVSISTQALRAIAYIHSLNIIHRDIKAENFLYASDPRMVLSSHNTSSSSLIKLIDFGLAVRLKTDNEVLTSVVGSAHYLAPEMIRQQYSKSVDLWSAGVMIYLMLFGRYPFDGNNDDIIISKIRKSKIEWNINNIDISHQARSFLQGLLERDPSLRMTASQALCHPFLNCTIAVPVVIMDEPKPMCPVVLESSSTGQPPSEDQYPGGPQDMEYYYSISKGDLSGTVPPAINQGRILRTINT